MLIKVVVSLLALLQLSAGDSLVLTIEGSMVLQKTFPGVLSSEKIEELQNEVVSVFVENLRVSSKCLDLKVEFTRLNNTQTQVTVANYSVSIEQIKCKEIHHIFTIQNITELGVSSFTLNSQLTEESAFWRDKMNSILVFAGCGVIIIIILVTCIIMVTKVHARETFDKEAADKRVAYQPYAADTMIMDVATKNRHSGDTNTIERWVRSQLGKRKAETGVAKPKPFPSFTFKKTGSQQDVSTTDSGIVTTSPRKTRNSNTGYTVECEVAPDVIGQYRKVSNSDTDTSYHELDPQYAVCNPNGGENINTAYLTDDSDQNSVEESSRL